MGCVAEPSEAVILTVDGELMASDKLDTQTPLCSMAQALGPEDPCSAICDPEAFADALVAAGFASGRCYLLQCPLNDTLTVSAAACLP